MTGWMAEKTKSEWATYASELEAEIERLRAALRKLHDIIDPGSDDAEMPTRDYVMDALEEARNALEGRDE